MSEAGDLYFVCGEASGDAHGAEVIGALKESRPGLQFAGVGGPEMREASGDGIHDWIAEAAVVGIWEVVKKYGYFKVQFDRVADEIESKKPAAVVLIDYPGFNLRMAKEIRKRGIQTKILYYISPQVWAWNRGRIPKMAKLLDLMICIFPFEKALYEKSGLHTEFGGHPMVDRLAPMREKFERDPQLVALLPGSREREVSKIFPILIAAAQQMRAARPDLKFAAAAASEARAELMRSMLPSEDFCEIGVGNAYELMASAGCGAVASGTATLEAAFLGLPYCLVYKVSSATYLAAKFLMKVDYLGMANILGEREVVREFLQGDATPVAIADELLRLTNSENARAALVAELREVTDKLGGGGAHDRAAKLILDATFS
ncbi:MAG: lipid-A-disaccharide synthase [Verrucomicrobiales bacterium]|jgi:lipid-A-disaccharide synthase